MEWIEESYFLRLPSGPPMQGDIWSNLPLPYSSPATCAGILITPRCDLVHDKASTANYLPLIPFPEFMETHGAYDVLEQEISEAKEALRRAAEPLGVKEAVELKLPTESLLQELIDKAEENSRALKIPLPKFQKLLTMFEAAQVRIRRIEGLLTQAGISEQDLAANANPKVLAKYKLAAARNTVTDLHFLPPCQDLLTQASVVLFRRVATSSIDLLRLAGNCMSQNEWDELRRQQRTPDFQATELKPERLLRLKSPNLECLMSRFGAFFGRVGVRDIERQHLESYVGLTKV